VKWDAISRTPETYADYLNEFVYGVKDRKEYLQKMGSGLLDRLRAKSRMCEGVDYGY
jgi:glutaconate CoA-transferase subunit A